MKIIAGGLGGRQIGTPHGGETRPAMARTRESLFSMLEARGMDWQGAIVLDLFAGTGSLAFEALSRGAAWAVLVDNSDELCKLIASNAMRLELADKCRIVKQDALRFLRKPLGMKFNLVFIDPPYRRDYVSPALRLLDDKLWLAENALVVAEVEKGAQVETPACFSSEGRRLFGQTMVEIWKKI